MPSVRPARSVDVPWRTFPPPQNGRQPVRRLEQRRSVKGAEGPGERSIRDTVRIAIASRKSFGDFLSTSTGVAIRVS